MFEHCHTQAINGIARIEWPDGKCFLEQETILVDVFDIIYDELNRMKN